MRPQRAVQKWPQAGVTATLLVLPMRIVAPTPRRCALTIRVPSLFSSLTLWPDPSPTSSFVLLGCPHSLLYSHPSSQSPLLCFRALGSSDGQPYVVMLFAHPPKRSHRVLLTVIPHKTLPVLPLRSGSFSSCLLFSDILLFTSPFSCWISFRAT